MRLAEGMGARDSGARRGASRWFYSDWSLGIGFSLLCILVSPGACSASGDHNLLSSGAGAASAAGGNGPTAAGGSMSTSGLGGNLFGGAPPGNQDEDGDGITDQDEGKSSATDTDMDGTPDYLDLDSDADCLPDEDELLEDWDSDGIRNFQDPINNGNPGPITLTAITTPFVQPIGIDFHEPTSSIVLSANYPSGLPLNFERIEQNGTHQPFSTYGGLSEEVKIATVRSGNSAGFVTGELFVGNGLDGQIVRISPDGATVQNPWVDLPGSNNGLMRGSMYVDRTGLLGGDLAVVTTTGQVWRVTPAGTPTLIATVGVHLEGVTIVPNCPGRFGPLAAKIIAGAEEQGVLWAFEISGGNAQQHMVGVNVEDIDMVLPNENFFGINYGTSQLLGAVGTEFRNMAGDILLTQETHTGSGLYRLQWSGSALVAQEVAINMGSAAVGQWEHVTFAAAGVNEIPPPPPPN